MEIQKPQNHFKICPPEDFDALNQNLRTKEDVKIEKKRLRFEISSKIIIPQSFAVRPLVSALNMMVSLGVHLEGPCNLIS